jgi:hypothetical protein
MPLSERALADLAETMFQTNAAGRLIGAAPDFHLLRTPDRLVCRCHEDLADDVAAKLQSLAQRPRGRPSQWAREYADYLRVLAQSRPLQAVRSGPLYGFPDLRSVATDAVSLDAGNADLLRGGLDEWAPDAALGRPMMAVVVGGRAVSVCTSVNASAAAHCAGVETVAGHRGKGFAGRAVTAWAKAVQAIGAVPYYGTTFDNLASQGVARNLGLELIAAEFTVERQRG